MSIDVGAKLKIIVFPFCSLHMKHLFNTIRIETKSFYIYISTELSRLTDISNILLVFE